MNNLFPDLLFTRRAVLTVLIGISAYILCACGGGGGPVATSSSGGSSSSGSSSSGSGSGSSSGSTPTPAPSTEWATATQIASLSSDSLAISNPQIATNSSGISVLVWEQLSGAVSNIYASRFDGVSWGSPVLLETSANNAHFPQVGIDNSGNALVIWEQVTIYDPVNDSRNNLWFARLNAATGTWAAAQQIATTNTNVNQSIHLPRLAVKGDDGTAYAVWTQDDNTGNTTNDVGYAYFNGSAWNNIQIIDNAAGDVTEAQISVGPTGRVIAVWAQSDGNSNNIRANRTDNGVNWVGVNRLDNLGNDADKPQITIDSSGNAIAIWQQLDDADISRVYYQRYAAGWGTATVLSDDTGAPATYPQIATSPNGKIFAVWQQAIVGTGSNAASKIYANVFNGSWGSNAIISGATNGAATFPRLAVDAGNTVYVIWNQINSPNTDQNNSRIVINTYVNTWDNTTNFLDADPNPTSADSSFAVIAAGAAGKVVTAWVKDNNAATNNAFSLVSRRTN